MKKAIGVITVCLFVFVRGHVANADTNIDQKTFTYFKSTEFQKQLYKLGTVWDRNILELETECTSKYYVNPVSFSIIKPLIFDSNHDNPQQGLWTFRFQFSRCKKTIIYNTLIEARQNGNPKMMRLVPGTTYCSPQLLRDVLVMGVSPTIALKSQDKTCNKFNVLNTNVTMKPTTIISKGKEIVGAWEEKWVVKNCDEKIDMTLCFIPDGKGGTSWVSGGCERTGKTSLKDLVDITTK